jgi:NifB/MoaA-like Fe-S oxidoreductase
VPVGLTDVGKHPSYLRRHTPEEAAAIVARTRPYRRRFREEFGFTFLYPSDELYLTGGVTVPPARHYDGYAQYQNGVGMVRSLLDEWSRMKRKELIGGRTVTAVCGELIHAHLAPMLGAMPGVDLVPVQNRYFGRSVNVSGLLTARDMLDALKDRELGEIVVMPRASLDIPGTRFLDNLTPADVEAELGRPVAFVETLKDLNNARGATTATSREGQSAWANRKAG